MATDKKGAPFEWLAGGIFFGKKGGIDSIDSSKDLMALVKGIDENLKQILGKTTRSVSTSASNKDAELSDPSTFLAARLSRLRTLLYDERKVTSQQEGKLNTPAVASTTLQGFTGEALDGLLPRLLQNLEALPFESRKHVAAIFNYFLVCGLDGSDAALYRPISESFSAYVLERFDEIMDIIVQGHDLEKHGGADIGLHYGTMYRSCIRYPALYEKVVGSTASAQRYVFPFLDTYVHVPNFDIASDSMESLKMVFTACQGKAPDDAAAQFMAELCATFLTRDYEAIWDERFNPTLLTESANYMTRRVALQILSSVLLTRSNYNVMVRYVADRKNLILAMKLLRDTSPHISLDAFHVFKVFVANPNKPPDIVKILKDNQEKLCKYLTGLHQDREEQDTQFRDEKRLIIATIRAL